MTTANPDAVNDSQGQDALFGLDGQIAPPKDPKRNARVRLKTALSRLAFYLEGAEHAIDTVLGSGGRVYKRDRLERLKLDLRALRAAHSLKFEPGPIRKPRPYMVNVTGDAPLMTPEIAAALEPDPDLLRILHDSLPEKG